MITKETIDISRKDFNAGEAILIDKPSGWSSFNVVSKIRNTIRVKKVGHAGTLDPMATGLLILCTGKMTKQIYKFQEAGKQYTGIISLGKKTESMDTESEIIETKPVDNISEEMIYSVRDEFLGDIKQIPPMYSALKHKGQPLYKMARKGKSVEREPRDVSISKFEITKIEKGDVHFIIDCSKGTYIRVIANDFGEKLGCGGVLSELRRTKIGDYSVDDALQIDQFVAEFKPAAGEKVNI